MVNVRTIMELREIYSTLSLMSNLGVKAYTCFILSSGMNRDMALDLTIGDLLGSCKDVLKHDYNDENKINSLKELLIKSPDNIIPIWVNETDTRYRVNFSSPESLFYLFLHLKKRNEDKDLKITDKLFDISSNAIDNQLNLSDKLTKMGSLAPSPKEGEVISHKFTVNDLRSFFEKQCLNHLPENPILIEDNHKMYVYKRQKGKKYRQYKVKLTTLFTEGLPKTDEFYPKFKEDVRILKSLYRDVLPYVTAKNYDTITPEWDKNALFIEKLGNSIEGSLSNVNTKLSTTEVTQIITSYVALRLRFILPEEMEKYLLKVIPLAIGENNKGYFQYSPQYLDFLIFKVRCEEILNELPIDEIEINVFGQEVATDELIELFVSNNIIETYEIDKSKFRENLLDLMDNRYVGKRMSFDIGAIIKALFLTTGFTNSLFNRNYRNYSPIVKG